jgi:hypothetical protein
LIYSQGRLNEKHFSTKIIFNRAVSKKDFSFSFPHIFLFNARHPHYISTGTRDAAICSLHGGFYRGFQRWLENQQTDRYDFAFDRQRLPCFHVQRLDP